MPKTQILMPMGGLGSRFAQQGFTTPKPLILVDGKPMFKRSLDSFAALEDKKYLFVIRQDHEDRYNLSSQIIQEIPDADITILQGNTRGAVETCMMAASSINDNLPIIVADCDIYFESEQYFEKLKQVNLNGNPDGVLLTFSSNEPRYSYVEIDDKGKAIRTAEKVVISEHAILGGYFFSSGELFKKISSEFLSTELTGSLKEYFMSHLFNILIEEGKDVEIAEIDRMYSFGTPEELSDYFSENSQG